MRTLAHWTAKTVMLTAAFTAAGSGLPGLSVPARPSRHRSAGDWLSSVWFRPASRSARPSTPRDSIAVLGLRLLRLPGGASVAVTPRRARPAAGRAAHLGQRLRTAATRSGGGQRRSASRPRGRPPGGRAAARPPGARRRAAPRRSAPRDGRRGASPRRSSGLACGTARRRRRAAPGGLGARAGCRNRRSPASPTRGPRAAHRHAGSVRRSAPRGRASPPPRRGAVALDRALRRAAARACASGAAASHAGGGRVHAQAPPAARASTRARRASRGLETCGNGSILAGNQVNVPVSAPGRSRRNGPGSPAADRRAAGAGAGGGRRHHRC